jgi:hypothetical protein
MDYRPDTPGLIPKYTRVRQLLKHCSHRRESVFHDNFALESITPDSRLRKNSRSALLKILIW